MKLMLALLWTFILVMDIVICATGGGPTWVSVFCPLTIVVLRDWIDYIESKIK